MGNSTMYSPSLVPAAANLSINTTSNISFSVFVHLKCQVISIVLAGQVESKNDLEYFGVFFDYNLRVLGEEVRVGGLVEGDDFAEEMG
jgi:hypothetical protein